MQPCTHDWHRIDSKHNSVNYHVLKKKTIKTSLVESDVYLKNADVSLCVANFVSMKFNRALSFSLKDFFQFQFLNAICTVSGL